MLYRLYSPGDFTALYAIEEVCFEPHFRFGRSYMRSLVKRADAATWIAEENGSMAGFAIVHWSRKEDAVTAYLETLEVLPEARGQGIARGLLDRCEDSAKAAGAETIWLHVDAMNAGAIRLYTAQGYLRRGRRENYYPHGRAAEVYRKRLTEE